MKTGFVALRDGVRADRSNAYRVSAECDNCGAIGDYWLPLKFPRIKRGDECPVCLCQTLRMKRNPPEQSR